MAVEEKKWKINRRFNQFSLLFQNVREYKTNLY